MESWEAKGVESTPTPNLFLCGSPHLAMAKPILPMLQAKPWTHALSLSHTSFLSVIPLDSNLQNMVTSYLFLPSLAAS